MRVVLSMTTETTDTRKAMKETSKMNVLGHSEVEDGVEILFNECLVIFNLCLS